jgi:hypothetical protein
MPHRVLAAVLCVCAGGLAAACAARRTVARPAATPGAGVSLVDATWRGDRARLTALLRQGVDVNRRGPQGQTALE